MWPSRAYFDVHRSVSRRAKGCPTMRMIGPGVEVEGAEEMIAQLHGRPFVGGIVREEKARPYPQNRLANESAGGAICNDTIIRIRQSEE
jgi:hypothetical protein